MLSIFILQELVQLWPPKFHHQVLNKTENEFHCGLFSFLRPVTETDVVNLLHSLDLSKSTGLHQIPIKFLKLATTVVAPISTVMFNCCIQEGTYSNILKFAQIIPIYKKRDKEKCRNYRPISLLYPINKVFEKLIYNQLQNYLTKKDLLTSCQYGFRTRHSTSLAVSIICDNIEHHLNNCKITCAIFLDLAKAFDTVDHSVLVQKLYMYDV